MRTRAFALPTLIVLVAVLIAACSGSKGGDDASPKTVPKDTVLDRADELTTMSVSECRAVNAYDYLEFNPVETPKVLPNGAHFHFDCKSGTWGWYFKGSDDTWEEPSIDLLLSKLGHSSGSLPLEDVGAPTSRRHPMFPEALTAEELKPEMTVCVRGDRSIGLRNITKTVSREPAMDVLISLAMPGWRTTDQPDYYPSRSLEADGVMPFPFGGWSTSHVTAGAC